MEKDTVEDKNLEDITKLKNKFLSQIQTIDRHTVKNKTRGQDVIPECIKEKLNRITTNSFGKICKLKPNTSYCKELKLYILPGSRVVWISNMASPTRFKLVRCLRSYTN